MKQNLIKCNHTITIISKHRIQYGPFSIEISCFLSRQNGQINNPRCQTFPPAHNRAERTTDVTRQWVCCSASVSGTDIDNNVLPTNIVCQTVTNYIAPYQQNTSHLFFGILKHLNYNVLHTAVVNFFICVLLTFYPKQ